MLLIAHCSLLIALLAACGETTSERFPSAAPSPGALTIANATPGPVPNTVVRFPEDEAPHNVLTEWWYYTGHVITTDGSRYGVEFVIFQGSRANFPIGYASHFAIIDAQQQTFTYEDAASIARDVRFGGMNGFDLRVNSWAMRGLNGTDVLTAAMTAHSRAVGQSGSRGGQPGDTSRLPDSSDSPTPPYAIQITATDVKGPVLEGGGQFSYGPGGSSYYYSRTRMRPTGTITVAGQAKQITDGALWFDHQWGNFLPTAGGWDWFSTQLDDGTELMIYHLRDARGAVLQTFGEYVPPKSGSDPGRGTPPLPPAPTIELASEQFAITPLGTWTSPATGITYPSGWRVQIAAKNGVPALDLTYTPVVPNAELDTRGTTGVTYWEGDTTITGTKNGQPLTGSGYVELTGYGKR
jgi:predicted secreted hydrolase